MPKVSVVIPTYNKALVVSRAIDSVLSQTYRDIEIIVVDDGSTDHTNEVLKSYSAKIKVIQQFNQERAVARNQGIIASSGEYIAFLDDDDWWHPEKLSRQMAFIDEYPRCGLVCSYAYRVHPNGKILGFLGQDVPVTSKPFDALPWFFMGHSIPTLTTMISREMLNKIGAFDQGINYIEDWDLWLRIAIDRPMVCVPEPLAYYQLHQRYMPGVFGKHQVQDGRIYVLEKALNILQGEGHTDRLSTALIARGLARAWWYGGLIDYALDHDIEARSRVERAYQADPVFFDLETAQNAWEMMVGFSVALQEIDTSYSDALLFIRRTYPDLPEEIKRLINVKRLISELSAWYGHTAYQHAEYRHAARFMKKAIINDLNALTNRGVMSVLVRSLIKNEKIQ